MANTILDSDSIDKLFIIDANPDGKTKYRNSIIYYIDIQNHQTSVYRYWNFTEKN